MQAASRRAPGRVDSLTSAGVSSSTRWAAVAAYGFLTAAVGLWLAVEFLTDRAWPVTIVAFGPRWWAALPLVPLALFLLTRTPGAVRSLCGPVALALVVLIFGLMDFRVGRGRAGGGPMLRVLTHNLGASRVTAASLDRLMKTEQIDLAALQECPFYDHGLARLGWHFYYGGDLCLVSRYPFRVLDEPKPEERWRRSDNQPDRYEIDTPIGRFQLLNVHLSTIRDGIEALRDNGWGALPRFADNRAKSARQSRAARRRIEQGVVPTVIAGDFNLPIESAIYRTDWRDLQNVFSHCGRGFGHTKLTRAFGIRIDHVLTTDHWQCVDARVLTSPYGGDHAPLIVDLLLLP